MPKLSVVSPVKNLLVILSMLSLVACGGGGGGGSSSSEASNRIFLYDDIFQAIGTIKGANPDAGVTELNTTIVGPDTNLFGGSDMVLDIDRNRLYVATRTNILAFDDATKADGDVEPEDFINSTAFDVPEALFLDTNRNELYVTDFKDGVFVFDEASRANGSLTPVRSITNSFDSDPTFDTMRGIAVDTTRDILYVSILRSFPSPIMNRIFAFNNASTVNGDALTADRIITLNHAGKLAIDSDSDRLYVSDNQGVNVFDGASTLSGSVVPSRVIDLSALLIGFVNDINVDFGNDRLYAIEREQLFIIPNASSLNGAATATVIQTNLTVNLQSVVVAP